MPHRLLVYRPYLWLSLFTLGGLWLLFGPLLWQPGQYLFSHAGDGLTPYYATPFFAQHDGGSWQTQFHYPWGNHLVYVANPLQAGFFRLLQPLIDLTPYTVALLNLTVILSFFPTAWLLYALLRRCQLPSGYSILMALVITFLSPQIQRITGHYSLAYPFFVPLLWSLLPGRSSAPIPIKSLALYVLTTGFFAFMHPYYFLLGAGFLYAWLLVRLLQARPQTRRAWLIGYLLPALAILLPGLLLKGWEAATRQGPGDFVAYPYGFLDYIAGFETIFLPQYPPFSDLWRSFIPVRKIGLEGYAYVGLVGLILLGVWWWRIGHHLSQGKGRRVLRPVLPGPLRTSIWAAVLLLIPAMAYPFQWVPEWLDYLGWVRQFRAVGRLAWVFYYVYMVMGAWFLYALYRRLRRRGLGLLGRTLIGLSVFSWMLSATALIRAQRAEFLNNPVTAFPERAVDFREALTKSGHQPGDFQALLALPYFHFGSEKLFLHDWVSTRYALAASLDTGLPLCNNLSARAPLSASLASIQLVSHPLIPKVLVDTLTDRRPLLLLVSGEPSRPGEKDLLARAKPLGEAGETRLFRLPLSAFAEAREAWWAQQAGKKAGLKPGPDGLRLSHHSQAVHYDPLGGEAGRWDAIAQGRDIPRRQRDTLFDGRLAVSWQQVPMEASFWIQADTRTNYLPILVLALYDGETEVARLRQPLRENWDVHEGWVRAQLPFVLPDRRLRVVMFVEGKPNRVAHLLIRPQAVDAFLSGAGESLWWNNYPR